MTAHSGRGQGGDLPYEGVVLPANGESWTPEQQRDADAAGHSPQPTAGRPWGDPWGPDTPSPPAGPPAAPPLPPAAQPGQDSAGGQWAPPPPPEPPTVPQGHGDADATQMLPPQRHPGPPASPGPGPLPPAADAAATQMLPPQQPPPSAQHGGHGGQGGHGEIGEPWPPQSGYGDADATQMLPPQQAATPPGGGETGQHWPPPAPGDADATQMLPPQQADPYGGQQAGWPPQSGYGDAVATQMLPPQQGHPGALPPEGAYGRPPATQQPAPADTGPPPGGAPYGVRPGAPGERQPPSEFDNLFRGAAPAPGPQRHTGPAGPDTTPGVVPGRPSRRRTGPAGPTGPTGPTGPAGPTAGPSGAARGPGRGRTSPAVLAGVGLVVVLAIGLGVGALTSGGGEDDPKAGPGGPTAPVGGPSEEPAESAEKQAKTLDKLLEQSNNSRNSVIRAVQNIKACQKLGQAAADLRAAADQRNGLVTRLSEIETGALPHSEQLNAALTEAWKASAKADDAYAAWADQVAGRKGCHKGKARTTQQTAEGNRASGEATAAKKKAAGLWNPTAREYGLPERQYTQL